MVKEQRNRKGISQIKLGELSGVSIAIIENFESGKHTNLTLENLLSIFTVLDLPMIPIIKPVTMEEERSKLLNDIVGSLASCDVDTLRRYHYSNRKFIDLIKHIEDVPPDKFSLSLFEFPLFLYSLSSPQGAHHEFHF